MSPRPALSGNAAGALWILASVAGATAETIGVRILSADMHTNMLVFLRAAFAALLVLPLLGQMRRPAAPMRFRAWKLHVLRGMLLAVSLLTGFYSIAELPVAIATILFFVAPIFATVLAIPIMGERVGPRRAAAIAAGFIGTLIILRPGVGEVDIAMLAAVGSAVAFALALLVGRKASRVDGSEAVFVSSSILLALATLPPALLHWSLPGEAWQWAILAGIVFGSSIRTYADIRAYDIGDAGFLAPFHYLRLVTVGIAGYVLFGEVLDLPTLLGGAIIIASTLYIALRERAPRAVVIRKDAP